MEPSQNRRWLWVLAALVMGATVFVAVRSVWWRDSWGTIGGRQNLISSSGGAIYLLSTRWHDGSLRGFPFHFSKWNSVKTGADERVRMQFFAFSRESTKDFSKSFKLDGWSITIGYVWILGLEALIFVPLVWKYGRYVRRETDTVGEDGGRRHHRILLGWFAALVIVGTVFAAGRSLSWDFVGGPHRAPIGHGFRCSSAGGAFIIGWIDERSYLASLSSNFPGMLFMVAKIDHMDRIQFFGLKWHTYGIGGKPEIIGIVVGYGWILVLEALIFGALLWKYRRRRDRGEREADEESGGGRTAE